MSYYTTEKVLDIIRNYHHNMKNINEWRREYASVGVAQYGIEASLPKANAISDVVASEALRQIEHSTFFANILTDIKYLQDRFYRVTDEKDAQVLNLRLNGLSSYEIGHIVGCSERNANTILRRIAETIIGYPQ